ncbi:MAG: DNA primase [SAR324 cluster bacterium]|nr:DNA primase [SAR324 cluster bacterium]
MGLTRETIQEIKARADIAQIVGDRVALTPSGGGFKGLCPFHPEKTPSFTVNPQRGIYHCFGCGEGGSVIDFVMAFERLPFGEAAESLAERLGISLGSGKPAPPRHRDLEALEAARLYYRKNLLERPEGEIGRRYLLERRFGEEMWEAFSLGFALDGWQGWTETGQRGGFALDDLTAAGLVKLSNGGRPYDLLRKRVVFPILDARGRCIAFGGRVVEALDEPKYLNTPETRHYHKGKVLFGLSQGMDAIRKSKRAILVEGYLDVMRLHERGFGEAVAACGTALTADHLDLLGRYTERVLLLFDGDEAGARAALRSVPLFLNRGIEAHVAALPDGLDPDDFLVQRGEAAVAAELEKTTPLLEYLVLRTLDRYGKSLQGRERTLAELVPLIGQIRRPTARDLALRHLADMVGVAAGAIEALLTGSGSRPNRAGGRAPAASSAEPAPAIAVNREVRHQRMLLNVLLHQRSLLPVARTMVRPEELSDPDCGQLYEKITRLSDEEFAALDWDGLTELFPSAQVLIRGLAVEPPPRVSRVEDWERVLRGEVARIKEGRRAVLLQRLKECAGTDAEEAALRELIDFRRELNALKPQRKSYIRYDGTAAEQPRKAP